MNALPFAMIRRNHNDSHDSQDAIQAAQSGQRSWPVATTVPSTKRVRSSRFPLARTERLETHPSQIRTVCPILKYEAELVPNIANRNQARHES